MLKQYLKLEKVLKICLLATLTTLLHNQCKYEVPVTEKLKIPVDTQFLGMWERIPAEGQSAEKDTKMLILKFNDGWR